MEKIENYCSSDPKDLINDYNKAIIVVKEKVKKENWRCNFDFWDDIEIDQADLINDSKTQRKKFRKRINRVLQKPSLRNINSLLGRRKSGKVRVSEKEDQIQLARKKWKVARDVSEKLLQEYKNEKGDFYKNKI